MVEPLNAKKKKKKNPPSSTFTQANLKENVANQTKHYLNQNHQRTSILPLPYFGRLPKLHLTYLHNNHHLFHRPQSPTTNSERNLNLNNHPSQSSYNSLWEVVQSPLPQRIFWQSSHQVLHSNTHVHPKTQAQDSLRVSWAHFLYWLADRPVQDAWVLALWLLLQGPHHLDWACQLTLMGASFFAT